MNLVKLLSPDFVLGKALVATRSVFEIGIMLAARPSSESVHLAKLILQVKPVHTMVRNRSLMTLYRMVRYVNHISLPGAIVECGVWKGGSSAMMAAACRDSATQRDIWLFDSFEGLPPPSKLDGTVEQKHYFKGMNKGSIESVQHIFRKLRLPLERVHFVKGWFEQTIPSAEVGAIAVLHIDADWYESVSLVLHQLYDRVVPGGYVILDDYGYWPGCDRAVHDFLDARAIPRTVLQRVGSMGVYFQKSR
jgi:O-methyltransferase